MTDRSTLLKQRLWRWHFLAGLVVCPFAILLALTGSIYLFKPQIDNYEERVINALPPVVDARSIGDYSQPPISTHINALLTRNPDADFKRVILNKPGDRSVEIELQHPQGEKVIYWVDSITGQILTSKNTDQRLMQRVKKLHSELLLGNMGSYVVELMASWLIILVVSGLYLWLTKPENQQAPIRLAVAKFDKAVPIKKWRSLHGVIGFWFAVPIIVLLLSGLPWTQLWGSGFDKVKVWAGWQGPGQEWFVTLKSKMPKGELAALPESSLWEIKADPHTPSAVVDRSALDWAVLDAIHGTPQVGSLIHPVQIAPPKPNNGVWTVRSMPGQRSARETLHFDQYSSALITRIGFKDHHPIEQLVSQGVSLHEGALFGWPNQLLGLLTALAIICISFFGLYSWWLRKPQDRVGVPDRATTPPSKGLFVGLVVLGLILPAAGISFVIIYIIEWFGVRRTPR